MINRYTVGISYIQQYNDLYSLAMGGQLPYSSLTWHGNALWITTALHISYNH